MSTLAPDTHAVIYPRRRVGVIMAHVMLALVPGTLLQAWLINERLLLILPIAIISAVFFEAIALRLRGRALRSSLSDGSIVLAAWLLVLCLPPTLPLWQLLVGIFILVMLGKHLYGGLGHNPFNPAMVAYAVLIISFPVTMSQWQTSEPVTDKMIQSDSWDAMSGATPLDQLRQIRLSEKALELSAPDTDTDTDTVTDTDTDTDTRNDPAQYAEKARTLIMSSSWTWVSLAWLAGGLYLLFLRIISWHIPLAVLSGVTVMYLGLSLIGSGSVLPVIPALLSGAIMLGSFFIATDPVTAATSRNGKILYGIGVGVLAVVIREFSSYPEGFAFAVLLMNTCVPLIDYLITGPAGQSRSVAP